MGMYEDLIEVDEEYERWASENPQYEDEPMAGRDFTYGDEEDEHGNVQQHTILDDPVYDAWYRNAYGDDPDTPTIERDLRAEETRDAMYRTVSGEAENRNTGLSGLLNKGLGKTYEGAVTGGWQGNNLTPYGMAFNIEDKPGLFDAANFAMNAATLNIPGMIGASDGGRTKNYTEAWQPRGKEAPGGGDLVDLTDPATMSLYSGASDTPYEVQPGYAGSDEPYNEDPHDPIDSLLDTLNPTVTPGPGGSANPGGDVPGTGGSPTGGGGVTGPMPIQAYQPPNRSYDDMTRYGFGPEHSFYGPADPSNIHQATAQSLQGAQWQPGKQLTWTLAGPRMILV